MKVRIYVPWKNLGCPGLRIGSFYADLYRLSGFPFFGLFINWNGKKYRLTRRKGFRRCEI